MKNGVKNTNNKFEMIIEIIVLILVLLYLLFITSALTCCVCYILFQINRTRSPPHERPSPKGSGNAQTKKLTFVKLTQDAEDVVQGTDKSAGYDIKACETVLIPARSKQTVKTGLRVEFPVGVYGRLASRSGLAVKHGIEVGAGVIDEDYEGELMVLLWNHSDCDFKVEKGDRICQFIPHGEIRVKVFIKNKAGEVGRPLNVVRSNRGVSGFGSTGAN